MKNTFIIILSLLFIINLQSRIILNRMSSFPYYGTILRNSTGDQYQVDFSGVSPGSNIHIHFQVTTRPLLTTTFLAVSSNQTKFKGGQLYIQSLYDLNFTALQQNIDVVGMQLDLKQYINRKKYDSFDDILYFTVYNMDPQYRCIDVNFTITISIDSGSLNALDCYPCANHGRRRYPSQNCLCQLCDPGFYGPDCSINMLTLTKGQVTNTVVNGPGMAYFLIDQSQEVTILVKQSIGIGEVYFQFIQYQGQFASYTNVAQGRNTDGQFNVTAGTGGTTFNAISTGTKMSLTVAVFNDSSIIVEASYSTSQKSNVLLIVLAVLGSVLFVGLLIAAIYIVRNSTWFQSGRQSRQVRPITQNMNDEQIERFFPSFLLKNVTLNFSHEESQIKLTQNNQSQSPNKLKMNVQDCVICLCPIEPEDLIKITYCRHIFHGVCLVGWFKKQQNCPYCRQQFTRNNTIKLYKKIKDSHQGAVMKGEQLANAIIVSKSGIIGSKDSLQILNEKDSNKIKIQSRNTIQIQNLS